MRLAIAFMLLVLASCVRSHNLPRVTPDVRSVGQGHSMSDNEQWNEAHDELDSLVRTCESRRTHLEHDADAADRTRRIAIAASVGAVVAGQSAALTDAERGVSIGDARCSPVAGPNTTQTPGSAAYTTGCRSTASGGGGPLVANSFATRSAAEEEIAHIQRALEAAFDWLDSHRDDAEWTDDDESEWHAHEVSITELCGE